MEWDESKAQSNIVNHRLSFDVAQYALFDPERLERADRSENNATIEKRWQVLGKVGKIIWAIYEDMGEVKHLISAWFAEKQERRV
jgi:uncharacterized DUF497 family protein